MKVLTILGSPRKKGNTAVLLKEYTEGVKEKYEDVEVNHIHLDDLQIHGCRGCMACQMGKVDFCATKDDMINLYNVVLDSDVLVFATSIYTFSMTAQMKAFIDRLFAVGANLHGKKVVSLAVFGDTGYKTSGVENHINVMEQMCDYASMELHSSFVVSSGVMPVSENEEAIEKVRKIALDL